MSKNLAQIFAANPITTIGATDVLYVVTTDTTDAAISGANLKALFASSTLTSAHIYVGNGSNVATDVAVSGDATLANTGALTVASIGGKAISLANSFTTSGNFAATLTFTNTTNATFPSGTVTLLSNVLTSAHFFIGSAGNVATDVAMSGDASLANTGAITVSAIGGKAISLANSFTTSGNFAVIQTYTNTTNVTFPTTGTLATTAQLNFSTYNDVSGTTQVAAVNNGYIISNAGQTTITLPATAAEGSIIAVQGKGAAGWILAANTAQVIHLGSSASSATGSLTSTNQWDAVEVVCVTANSIWAVKSVIGNLTVA